MADDKDTMDEWAAAMAEAEGAGDGAEPVELEELRDEKADITVDEKRKLDTILDIPVTISMEVGRAKISIRNLLQLNQGSVVELERVAGEPLRVEGEPLRFRGALGFRCTLRFRRALQLNASAVILVHNHPSGDPAPSQADHVLTSRLKQALELVSIRTLDHIIVGSEGCVSLAELNQI